jgi:hypothetical protein
MSSRRTLEGPAARGRHARRTIAVAFSRRRSRAPTAATGGTDEQAQRRTARRGLAIYFAVLIPSSGAMYAVAITYGIGWAAVGMFIPALASTVARVILHEPFAEIGFRLRDRRVLGWIGFGIVAPIAIGAIAYGTAWIAGLTTFSRRKSEPPPRRRPMGGSSC